MQTVYRLGRVSRSITGESYSDGGPSYLALVFTRLVITLGLSLVLALFAGGPFVAIVALLSALQTALHSH